MADTQANIQQELDEMQAAYRAAVEEWIVAIREEEALAAGPHSVAEVDKWEHANYREHSKHREVIYRKKIYEDALRREFFGF